jgi:hypothetical protein
LIHSVETMVKPRMGEACGLGRGHVDPPTLTLIFHYEELVNIGGTWQAQPRQQVLALGMHFTGNAAAGTLMLLEHPLWETQGRWRAADREEPLLYKGQVKAPQYVAVSFDHYAPEQVEITTDKTSIAGDGSDPLTISVVAEAGTDPVPVAVYNGDGEKVGSIPVSMGQRTITSSHAGTYRLEANRDVMDPTWNLPVFGPAIEHGSVTVEVLSA